MILLLIIITIVALVLTLNKNRSSARNSAINSPLDNNEFLNNQDITFHDPLSDNTGVHSTMHRHDHDHRSTTNDVYDNNHLRHDSTSHDHSHSHSSNDSWSSGSDSGFSPDTTSTHHSSND